MWFWNTFVHHVISYNARVLLYVGIITVVNRNILERIRNNSASKKVINGRLNYIHFCNRIRAVSKIGKSIHRTDVQVTFELRSFQMFAGPSFQINYIYQALSHSVGFKAHRGLWNPLNPDVLDKFRGSGGQSKRKWLHDRADFYRSLAWWIVLILTLH